MPTTVVHVVDVIAVRHRDMATPGSVGMLMPLVHRVAGWLTFVVVIVVLPMKVPVVHEVDVTPVRDRDMAASFAVQVLVFGVLIVDRAGHRCSPPYRFLDTNGADASPIVVIVDKQHQGLIR